MIVSRKDRLDLPDGASHLLHREEASQAVMVFMNAFRVVPPPARIPGVKNRFSIVVMCSGNM